MVLNIRKATRGNLKGRIAITGPSGSGKTTNALWMAEQLAPSSKILVIDTEKASSELYAKGKNSDGFEFDIAPWEGPFNPLKLSEALDTYGGSYDVIIIDSLSHFWNGPGGVLEIADRKDWRTATPMQDRMVEAILQCSAHVICTMRARTKMEYEKDSSGRLQVRTLGMKAIQRDEIIYEFTMVFTIDKESHKVSVEKTRMTSIEGHTFQTETDVRNLGRMVNEWLTDEDSDALEADEAMKAAVQEAANKTAEAVESLTPEEIAASKLSDEQIASVKAIFDEIADEAARNNARSQFGQAWGNPKEISAGRFDTVISEARKLAQQAAQA